MDQVFVQHSTANRNLRLTAAQHYNAKHCFRCGGCDRKFKTEESMNQVSYLVPWSALDCYPLTATPALRHETHFWLMMDLRRKESEGLGSFSSVSVKHGYGILPLRRNHSWIEHLRRDRESKIKEVGGQVFNGSPAWVMATVYTVGCYCKVASPGLGMCAFNPTSYSPASHRRRRVNRDSLCWSAR